MRVFKPYYELNEAKFSFIIYNNKLDSAVLFINIKFKTCAISLGIAMVYSAAISVHPVEDLENFFCGGGEGGLTYFPTFYEIKITFSPPPPVSCSAS